MIKAKEFIKTGFSVDDAETLKKEINPLFESNKRVVIDFVGIVIYTTLFFNFLFGPYIMKTGPNKFKKKIVLINLSQLGLASYQISYENAATKRKKTPHHTTLRDIGYNVHQAILDKYESIDAFCKQCNYSVNDVQRLCEGRLMLIYPEFKELADSLGVNAHDLLRKPERYENSPFKDKNTEDFLLDMIDTYIAIVETNDVSITPPKHPNRCMDEACWNESFGKPD